MDAASVFHDPAYAALTTARIKHLSTLALFKPGDTVLEVGAGLGDFTEYLLSVGCTVTATDARKNLVDLIKQKYPKARTTVLDLDVPEWGRKEVFDWVFCYGTLYHLSRPLAGLQFLRSASKRILLETCVSHGSGNKVNHVSEVKTSPSQAVSGTGCRPTRDWVFGAIKDLWGNAYAVKTRPRHPQFPKKWIKPVPYRLSRAIFVGSESKVDNEMLLNYLPNKQETLR